MPLREDLLNPIPGPNPSGENLRYAPVYDQIKEARREEEDIAQGDWKSERKKADWVLVVKLAGEALAKKSKDLQVAAWLTEALLRREGFAGLNDGLTLIRGLLDAFWDTLYPELEDGDSELRAAPLEWIGSRLDGPIKNVSLTRTGLDWMKYKESRSVPYESDSAKADQRAQALQDGKLAPEEFDAAVNETPLEFYEQRMEQLAACQESVESLNGLCEEKFGDYSPNFSGARKSLEDVQQIVRVLLAKKRGPVAAAEETVAAEPEYAASSYAAAAAAAPARAPARPPAPKSLAADPVDKDDAIGRVAAVAKWMRQNDAYDPAPYLMVRGLRWGELRAGGSAPDASLLQAPPTEVRQELKRLAADGSWQELLDACENAIAMPCGRAWLDPHRYAARALRELGYEAIAIAIESETRALAADIPGLADMTLADDTPAANSETRAWLKEQARGSSNDYLVEQRPQPLEEEQLGTSTVDAFELAMEQARSGNVSEAIEILSREVAQEASGRARFRRKVQLAQVCMGAGHDAIAYPILESLAEEIERRGLEQWEAPDTLAHPLALLFRCMGKMDAGSEEMRKIYGRICRLDPVQALGIPR